jgi:hypothetical protein
VKKIVCLFLLLGYGTAQLAACSTGSHVLIGNTRSALPVGEVKLYLEPPAKYEVIALVRGYSVTGWTQQQDTDGAVEKMKAEAAALGANGVILSGIYEGGNAVYGSGISNTGEVNTFSGGVSSEATVSGQAIYVP